MTSRSRTNPTVLRELAHARTGDKGHLVTMAVVARNKTDYRQLREHLTPQVVREHLAGRISGNVARFEMPGTTTLLFVCERDPTDTVNTSLHRDRHGKTLSGDLLDLIVPFADRPTH
ncbi:AtuA-related protein [Streptomyces chartreusis]